MMASMASKTGRDWWKGKIYSELGNRDSGATWGQVFRSSQPHQQSLVADFESFTFLYPEFPATLISITKVFRSAVYDVLLENDPDPFAWPV
jgi:hypothetical protein